MEQKAQRLINFFRTFSYSGNPFSMTSQENSALQTLEESIVNGNSLIDLYEQKLHFLSLENEELTIETHQLRSTLSDERLEAQKIILKERGISEELRKQLMEKDIENKMLSEKMDQIQILRLDQLQSMRNQENQDVSRIFQNQINQMKANFEKIMRDMEEKIYQKQLENNELSTKIQKFTQQINDFIEENQKLRALISQQPLQSQNQIYEPFKSPQNKIFQSPQCLESLAFVHEPFIPQLQIIDFQYLGETSGDEVLNYSYEDHPPTALKDALNFSGCASSRFNMKEFMRSKEKQRSKEKDRSKDKENIDDNLKFSRTNSSKKLCISSEKLRLNMSNESKQNGQINTKEPKPILKESSEHRIQEFTTSSPLDPYYVFFALTAQCVKINSQHFQKIAEIDIVDKEWENVINQRVPMNLWAGHLEKALMQKVNI